MLTRLVVSNFKSLGENNEVLFGAFTVLVGQNGAGKSNVTDVIRFVADAQRQGLDSAVTSRGGMRGLGRWSGGRPYDVHIAMTFETAEGTGSYDLRVGSRNRGRDYRILAEHGGWSSPRGEEVSFAVEKGKWTGPDGLQPEITDTGLVLPLIAADRRLRPLSECLRNAAVYSLFPDVLRRPQEHDPQSPMREHGENWASTLRELLRDRTLRSELVVGLNAVVGDIADARTEASGHFLLPQFEHSIPLGAQTKQKKWFDASQESDGTLRVAGLLTALLQTPAPSFIAIEEPELTVHPGVLPVLSDYLRERSGSSQVVITTHSPDLLDLVSADEIRVVQRAGGVTTVSPVSGDQRTAVKDHLIRPGELLRIEGLQSA